MATYLTKSEQLKQWREMKEPRPIMPHFETIPNKSEGSTYGTCGIRIDGTPQFIEAVLSHLTELLEAEGSMTRLQLSRNTVEPTNINGQPKTFGNATDNAQVCYIRRHERGAESQRLGVMIEAVERRTREKPTRETLQQWLNNSTSAPTPDE